MKTMKEKQNHTIYKSNQAVTFSPKCPYCKTVHYHAHKANTKIYADRTAECRSCGKRFGMNVKVKMITYKYE